MESAVFFVEAVLFLTKIGIFLFLSAGKILGLKGLYM
jgi:hypothetical protein